MFWSSYVITYFFFLNWLIFILSGKNGKPPCKSCKFLRYSKSTSIMLHLASILTYLAWSQPVIDNLRLIFNCFKIKNVLLVVKSLIKNSDKINLQRLISSHSNQLPKVIIENCSLKKIHFRTALSEIHSKILPSKMHFKSALLKTTFQNCSLKDIFN